MHSHLAAVEKIQKALSLSKGNISLSKTSTNTLRSGLCKNKAQTIDLSSFQHVIEINQEEKWVLVEPRVTMENLCQETLKYGLIPPVVPEFRTITVGGAIMGGALESSSHRYGQFNDQCLEYELILGDGSCIKASKDQQADLFYGLPGSYGTLALLTLVKIRLIPAPPFVKVRYTRFCSQKDLLTSLKEEHSCDFLDGLLISSSWGVKMEGIGTHKKEGLPSFNQKKWWATWYHSHVVSLTDSLLSGQTYEEILSIQDYLFRYDRGAFWMGRFMLNPFTLLHALMKRPISQITKKLTHFAKKLTPKTKPSWLFRFLFGWTFSSQKLYRLWHQTPREVVEQLFFIQDFYVPENKIEESVDFLLSKTQINPLWLCPIKGTQTPQFLSPHFNKTRLINVGLYGVPKENKSIPFLTAEIEKEMIKFGSRKLLYSLTYYSQDLFTQIYDHNLYHKLRKKYFSQSLFLPLYNKVTDVIYSLGL